MRQKIVVLWILIGVLNSCQSQSKPGQQKASTNSSADSVSVKNPYYSRTDTHALKLPDQVWEKVLPSEVYQISRNKGTEWAFSGKYWDFEGIGTYYCVACGNALFNSDAKFASSCGWPSFYKTIRPKSVIYIEDHSHGMHRTEVVCGRCQGHLGHIFDDGPPPTGKRFCMNSLVLDFEPKK